LVSKNVTNGTSALLPKADIGTKPRDVCFVPILLQKAVEGFLSR
jgi:hypothetical protein